MVPEKRICFCVHWRHSCTTKHLTWDTKALGKFFKPCSSFQWVGYENINLKTNGWQNSYKRRLPCYFVAVLHATVKYEAISTPHHNQVEGSVSEVAQKKTVPANSPMRKRAASETVRSGIRAWRKKGIPVREEKMVYIRGR